MVSNMRPLLCLSAPDRCVSRVGTGEVLDQEKEKCEISVDMNGLQEEIYETRESHEYSVLIDTQIVRDNQMANS